MLSHIIWTRLGDREGAEHRKDREEMHAAGISHFGAIMELHYQSENCPGRPIMKAHMVKAGLFMLR